MIRSLKSTLLFVCLYLSSLSVLWGKNPESPKREFRGVWIATISNIDWPSRPGLSSEKQKEELIQLLNMHQKNGFNAVIFQVRPACDALYPSELEPWSRYLSGEQGKAPNPFYDPLAFIIEECHKRNMEFHAWCNPYRVKQSLTDSLSANHLVHQHPEWVIEYGNRWYLDPANPEVRNHVTRVVADIVSRYDVDAIHFDDYFYPYKVQGKEFPDESSFEQYGMSFTPSQKDDWRRNNVDQIIQQLNDTIKSLKPWVKFGISPFGVWRNKANDPNGSETRALSNYDDLYADILKWLKNGWIDYVLPQLYWEIGHPAADFETLVEWWPQNRYNRSLYIGLATYKTNKKSSNRAWKRPRQILRQIELTRSQTNISGCSHYSSNHFRKKRLKKLTRKLQKKAYNHPALIPSMPWIDKDSPATPVHIRLTGEKTLSWEMPDTPDEMNKAKQFVIYAAQKNQTINLSDPEQILSITHSTTYQLPNRFFKRKYRIGITSLDRLYNESTLSEIIEVKF